VTTPGRPARPQLAAELRKICAPAGGRKRITQQKLADLSGVAQGTIQKTLSGATWPEPETIEAIVANLPASEAERERVLALYRFGEAPDSPVPQTVPDILGSVPKYARSVVGQEPQAAEVYRWSYVHLPGPLQCEPYMVKLFGRTSRVNVNEPVVRRRVRQQVFRARQLRHYECVLYEEVLHRVAAGCGLATAREQIDVLTRIVDGTSSVADDRTRVRLVPRSSPALYWDTDFVVLRFPNGSGLADLAYAEHVVKGHVMTAEKDVAEAMRSWHAVRADALSRADTRDLLADLRKRFTPDGG
jgi:transcriptional regulator with XRE-family HTH domain